MAIANRLPILFALIVFATAQSAAYEQCGVQGWTGLATCVSGYVCTYNNAFYSQRLPTHYRTLVGYVMLISLSTEIVEYISVRTNKGETFLRCCKWYASCWSIQYNINDTVQSEPFIDDGMWWSDIFYNTLLNASPSLCKQLALRIQLLNFSSTLQANLEQFTALEVEVTIRCIGVWDYTDKVCELDGILSPYSFGSCAAAIELTGNENPTRVYYQNKDDNIHELCGNGPLSTTYSDNVITVARNIRSNTPIAAISWYNFQQIRVYYITNTNEVAEAVFDVDRWVAGNQQLGIAAPNSGLLCAIVDPQSTIRVCFQSASDPETITEALWTMTVAGEWTTDIANIS
ncbi:secreted glycosyl hydrolase/cellulase [Serpula lacrymans var. lacrymans S7.9]|uniref:Secreted glycosyl hydrolase/cellulase n=1 Tax=Serpula lacrymans var. lacrymans (strain S7.9) TaxID=578457 RepID=F8NWV4_SERL9|nr:secreted glycosyl hydrolase/cellulase [Serpula lacrymans var. lacrymans S7.9]EGO25074.1 secreted glycosyl hydrolase/cellulase [Serpula lacrymans var. lacrymans S7.9]